MTDISRTAVLASISVGCWNPSVNDKRVTAKVEQDYQAHDSGAWKKLLVAKEAMAVINRIKSDAWSFHYSHTVPYGRNNGLGLLAVSFQQTYRRTMEEYATQYARQADIFEEQFPEIKEQARLRLNGMYNEADYPSNVRAKFYFRISFDAVPQSSHLIADLCDSELERIRQENEERFSQQLLSAKADLWFRMKDAVGHMADRLTSEDAIFRNSLVTNVRELAEALGHLNVTGDEEVETMRQRLESLARVEPQDLRDFRDIRQRTATEAVNVLDDISDIVRKLTLDD